MNITVNSQLLAVELRLLNKVVPTKPAIAILSHALITADESGISLYATDLEVGLKTPLEGRVDLPGKAAVPVARLLAMVEQFLDEDVTLAVEKNSVVVRCGQFRGRLQVMPVVEFPQVPVPEGEATTLDAASLAVTISRTRYAVNDATGKTMLRGILLTAADGAGAMIATDGKRLAIATMGRILGAPVRVILPAKTIDALSAQLTDGEVELIVGQRNLFATVNRRLVVSRMLEGQFPAYERIIPQSNDRIVTVDRASMTAALKRVALVSEESRAVYISLGEDKADLTAASAEVGSAAEPVRVTYAGPPLRVCVNGDYLLDFLQASSRQSVSVELKDDQGAALLKDGEDHVAVIMLMRGN